MQGIELDIGTMYVDGHNADSGVDVEIVFFFFFKQKTAYER